MQISLSESKDIDINLILDVYKANGWSAADKPKQLHKALMNSDALVSAWIDDQLAGIGNAISDGHLVVYYPHLLVHPEYQGKGIGKMIVDRLQQKYGHLHMQMLTADKEAIDFYNKMGFERAGDTQAMWVYAGGEH